MMLSGKEGDCFGSHATSLGDLFLTLTPSDMFCSKWFGVIDAYACIYFLATNVWSKPLKGGFNYVFCQPPSTRWEVKS